MSAFIDSAVAFRRYAYRASCAFVRENRAAVIFVIVAGLAFGSALILGKSAGGLLSTQNSAYISYVLLLVASLFFALPNYSVRYWVDLKAGAERKDALDAFEREQGNESAEFAAFGILLLVCGFLYQVVLLRAAA